MRPYLLTFVAAVSLISCISGGMAQAIDDRGGDVGAPEVQYFSWCSDNKVLAQDDRGAVVLRQDCSSVKLKCVATERIVGPHLVHFAQCK